MAANSNIPIHTITPENYDLVIESGTKNAAIYEDKKFLLCRKSDKQLFYIHENIVISNFPCLQNVPETEAVEEEPSTNAVTEVTEQKACDNSVEEELTCRTTWTKPEIMQLISLYTENEKLFHSSNIKNDRVWTLIAAKIPNHTAEQCKNKFKYLKGKYVEKKENMGSRRTGEKAMKFEYFDILDSIFGTDHNIQPVALASSSRGTKNLEDLVESHNTQNEPSMKRKKKSVLEKQLQQHEANLEQREATKKARHKELLHRQDRALEIFDRMAASFDKAIDKLAQK